MCLQSELPARKLKTISHLAATLNDSGVFKTNLNVNDLVCSAPDNLQAAGYLSQHADVRVPQLAEGNLVRTIRALFAGSSYNPYQSDTVPSA